MGIGVTHPAVTAVREKLEALLYACRRGTPEGIPEQLVVSADAALAALRQLQANQTNAPDDLYLLQMVGDVEPELHGPYTDDAGRLEVARQIREEDGDLADGLYRLNIAAGATVTVDCFSGGELQP